MGLRDWPQQLHREPFTDECNGGTRRYVLEGSGTVSSGEGDSAAVGPNALITVDESCTLTWAFGDGVEEIVLLTPEYQGPPLFAVAAAFALMTAGLAVLAAPAGAVAEEVRGTVASSAGSVPDLDAWMALCNPPSADEASQVSSAVDDMVGNAAPVTATTPPAPTAGLGGLGGIMDSWVQQASK